MSIKETPRAGAAKQIPVQNQNGPAPTQPATTPITLAGRLVAVTRIAMGLLFAWAFVDKLFGFGYATGEKAAWINGGSPTKGFLGGVDHGPFETMFRSWAGDAWADWLFMLGLAAIAVALLAGIGLRMAAVAGTIMMLLMWAAEWPLDRHTSTGELTRSTNPIIDYHIVYALVLIALAALSAGAVWGLSKWWAKQDFVQKNRWLI
jgi:thiosulfate dehydrogenase (quinone) large subunit